MPFCLIGALGGTSSLTGFALLLVSSGAASFFGVAFALASFLGDALASFLGDAFGSGDALGCGGTSVDDEACVFGGLPALPFGSCCPSGEVMCQMV